jgi:hypothetical protein
LNFPDFVFEDYACTDVLSLQKHKTFPVASPET